MEVTAEGSEVADEDEDEDRGARAETSFPLLDPARKIARKPTKIRKNRARL